MARVGEGGGGGERKKKVYGREEWRRRQSYRFDRHFSAEELSRAVSRRIRANPVHACMHAHTHARRQACIYVCMHACTRTHVHACRRRRRSPVRPATRAALSTLAGILTGTWSSPSSLLGESRIRIRKAPVVVCRRNFFSSSRVCGCNGTYTFPFFSSNS